MVGALIVVAVVSMLAYSALSGDQLPSEEEKPEQEEVIVEQDEVGQDPVLTPGGTPEDQLPEE